MVTIVATGGVVTLILSRLRRISDLGADVQSLEAALSEEKSPLLPEAERAELLQGFKDFDVTCEVRNARMSVLWLGLVAVAVILAAGIWIIAHDNDAAAGTIKRRVSLGVPTSGGRTLRNMRAAQFRHTAGLYW